MGLRMKRLFLIIVSGVLAWYIGYHVIPDDVAATRETISVLRFKSDLGIHQIIREGDIEITEVGAYNFPSDVAWNKEDVIGSYLKNDVSKGQFVYKSMLEDAMVPSGSLVHNEERLDGIALDVDLKKCVGGIPNKGDMVRVIFYIKNEQQDMGRVIIDRDLNALEVVDILNGDGLSIIDGIGNEKGYGASSLPSVVVLKANTLQVAKLVTGINEGELHLTLRPRNIKTELDEGLGSITIYEDTSKTTDTSDEGGFVLNE